MYESPIRLLVQQLETSIREQQEKQIFEAVQKCGVNVDREELIKALAYDRAQYAQGYSDGRADAQRWISVEDEQKPMHGHDYLCVCTLPDDPEHKFVFISVRWWNATTGNGYVDRPHFSDEGMEGMIVTHWMPLPELPKEAAP